MVAPTAMTVLIIVSFIDWINAPKLTLLEEQGGHYYY